jgi:autotransporter-associated beta strand protein
LDNGTFAVDAGSTLNMTGSIASGSITKNGPGLMRLLSSGMSGTPVNRHTGATVINGGTLEIYGRSADNGGFTSLGTGSVTINNGGTLITANDWALGNEWNGGNVGTVTVNAGGTLTINSAGNTIRNGLVLNGGTVNGSGANTDWGGIYLKSTTVTAGGNAISTISVDTALDTTITMSVNSGSQLNYSGNLRDKIGSTGGIAKSGAGTLTLSGANNYTGVTNVNVGSLKLAKNSALYNGSTGSWTAANVKIASGATLALNVGGTGEFNSSHVTTLLTNLGGANGTSSAGFAAGSFIAFDTTNAPQGNFTVADSISDSTGTGGGALGVTKLGSGTLTLSSTNTYTGATNVNGGQLVVNGNISTSNVTVASGASIGGSGTVGALTVNAGGTVAPGNSPGILNTGDYNQAGTLVAEITGLVAGSGHDQINVMGTVNLSGALDLQFSASQDYVLNSMIFLILNNGSDAVTGTFTGLAQGATAATFGGFDWVISYTANSTDTTFTGGNDVALMAIPEPSTALLGGLGVLGLLRRRRK